MSVAVTPMAEPPPRVRPGVARAPTRDWTLAAVWSVSAVYLLVYAFRGWIPHDEGTLAQTAERVLLGELPHRDFVDVYTGGLTYLHALAFRIVGVNLVAPRLTLLVFALAWVPVVFWIAARFCRPRVAGALTLLALTWGPPNYFASLPSWYNLFFATFAAAALLRFTEVRRRHWLVLAGAAAGASILAKLSGVFLLIAGCLYLAYLRAEDDSPSLAQSGIERPDAARPAFAAGAYAFVVSLGALGFLLALLYGMRALLGAPVLYHLYLPVATITGWVVWRQWRSGGRRLWGEVRELLGLLGPFVAGAALPLALFLLPYVSAGATGDLLRGVFVLPFRRVSFAAALPPPVGVSLLAVLPAAGLLLLPFRARVSPFVLVLGAGLVLLVPAFSPAGYQAIFMAAAGSVPVVVAAGVALVAWSERAGADAQARHRTTLLLLLLALCGLVQFPYATPIYYCYVAPIEVLALASALALPRRTSSAPLWVAGALAGGFAALWLNTCVPGMLGGRYARKHDTALLPLPRGGIRVAPRDSALFAQLGGYVRAHARGRFIYAGPDAAQVYFLTGELNPTRDYYDFFDDAARHDENVLAAIAAHDVSAVVLNMRPGFSRPPSPALVAGVQARFPQAVAVGPFVVAWR